jgi:HPt (histidine-containing phosphotransfer) domain-containing protein
MGRFADTGSFALLREGATADRRDTQRAVVNRNPVLDLDHLRIYTSGDRDLEREVLGLFLGELPKTLASLTAAKSPREWHMAAHTLKGSALGIGAATLAQRAREAEALQAPLPASRGAIIAAITAAISDVTCEIERLGLV